ncbi:MAG: hypothetical protein NVSMB2_03810 [Chloroflexota bacterium]
MILDEILAHKRLEVAERMRQRPRAALETALGARSVAKGGGGSDRSERFADAESGSEVDRPRFGSGTPSTNVDARGRFARALRAPGVSVIAEIKRKSPSGGELRPGASAGDLATLYAANGAAALSVLTDNRFFGGTDADLVSAREVSRLPVLRKDFVVDAYQIVEAAALHADAILLIVRALSDTELRAFLQLATDLNLDALVEAHSAEEVQRALHANATIIGVNNRDLDTLITDVTLALRLRSLVPRDLVFVAESGLSRPEQLRTLRDAQVDAVLIGETLVRSDDPGQTLKAFTAAGAPAQVSA